MKYFISAATLSSIVLHCHASEEHFRAYCQNSAGEQQYSISVIDVRAIAQHREGKLSIEQSGLSDEFASRLAKQSSEAFDSKDCRSIMSVDRAGTDSPVVRVNFAFDSYGLTPMAKTSLNETSATLSEASYELIIEGHTDNQGSEQYNQGLGLRRALSVHETLLIQGIELDRMTVKSLGESQPLAPNNSTENRAKNRRAEVYAVSENQ
jgi:outer membrane protein OmpA-like peptidoglycan-associated protein